MPEKHCFFGAYQNAALVNEKLSGRAKPVLKDLLGIDAEKALVFRLLSGSSAGRRLYRRNSCTAGGLSRSVVRREG